MVRNVMSSKPVFVFFFKRCNPIIMTPTLFLARFTSLELLSLLSFLHIQILGRMSTIPWMGCLILLTLVCPVTPSIMLPLLFSTGTVSKEMDSFILQNLVIRRQPER
ncbi:hypothetical protein V8G54_029710 [Vigna mungo]|uniref:Uncharacterized protein n=1 Tax=Vigna mungo TaxID=3915 RepID=A0AAQ3MVQ6_VIGMU